MSILAEVLGPTDAEDQPQPCPVLSEDTVSTQENTYFCHLRQWQSLELSLLFGGV